ncbi:MAG: HAD family phosphatase [Verrucomicrobiales bacterium]|jgi:HAD superfamily hydrolase (TIGR01509 family)|nr:HAD family phosphatase [Verrucomicrobiales bacterium]
MLQLTIPPGDFAGYIFDCDGTLADTMPAHYRAWARAFKDYRAPFDFTEDRFYRLGGVAAAGIIAQLNREYGTDYACEELAAHKEALFERLLTRVEPIRPVCDFARRAAAAGRPVSVASGGFPHIVRRTLQLIGLAEIFQDRIVTPDMVAHGKPAPDMFLRAAQLMRVAPADCLVFEDAIPGIEGAKAAGMRVVLVPSRPAPNT